MNLPPGATPWRWAALEDVVDTEVIYLVPDNLDGVITWVQGYCINTGTAATLDVTISGVHCFSQSFGTFTGTQQIDLELFAPVFAAETVTTAITTGTDATIGAHVGGYVWPAF